MVATHCPLIVPEEEVTSLPQEAGSTPTRQRRSLTLHAAASAVNSVKWKTASPSSVSTVAPQMSVGSNAGYSNSYGRAVSGVVLQLLLLNRSRAREKAVCYALALAARLSAAIKRGKNASIMCYSQNNFVNRKGVRLDDDGGF